MSDITIDSQEVEEAAVERRGLNLSAAEWFADSGIDFGQELGLFSAPDLIVLRMRLIDAFRIGDYDDTSKAADDRLMTWLVEAVDTRSAADGSGCTVAKLD